MDRSIPMLLIGLVFGGGIGFAVAATSGATLEGHDHGDPAHHSADAAALAGAHPSGGHQHGAPLSLPDDGTAPRLSLDLQRDPSTGWNLHLVTTNFRFAPERASLAHAPGEGHAHVYVNGVKLGRFYGSWVHLDNLPAGEVTVEVTLNANDHRPLAVAGRPVAATVVIPG